MKEIIGHLINSASNNHQRFIGLQFVTEMALSRIPEIPDRLDRRGKVQRPAHLADLLLLWKQYNILIAHIIETVNKEKLGNYLLSGDKKMTLEFLITDYFRHLKDHLVPV